MYICTVQQLYDFQKANQQKRCKCRGFFKLMAVLASPLSILQEPGSQDAILKSETMQWHCAIAFILPFVTRGQKLNICSFKVPIKLLSLVIDFLEKKNIGKPDVCNSIEEDANKLKSEDQFSAKKDAHRPSAALLFDPSTPSEN